MQESLETISEKKLTEKKQKQLPPNLVWKDKRALKHN